VKAFVQICTEECNSMSIEQWAPVRVLYYKLQNNMVEWEKPKVCKTNKYRYSWVHKKERNSNTWKRWGIWGNTSFYNWLFAIMVLLVVGKNVCVMSYLQVFYCLAGAFYFHCFPWTQARTAQTLHNTKHLLYHYDADILLTLLLIVIVILQELQRLSLQ